MDPVPGETPFLLFERWLKTAWGVHQSFLHRHQFSLGELKTLYFGGGTPSLWGTEGVRFFRQFLRERGVHFSSPYEWTMEINPGSWGEECQKSWMELGVNRFSVGVQSLRDDFLQVLDRIHRQKEVLKTLKVLQAQRVNYSVDFMIGLPHSVSYRRDIIGELQQILDFSPSHISLYILTVPSHYPHFKELPEEEFIRDEYLKVSEYLQRRGMVHYEVSNYALPGRESWHNLQYWFMQPVAALGPSATGLLVKGGEDHGIRYKWKTTAPEFAIETLTSDQINLERLYMRLRTHFPMEDLGEFIPGANRESCQELIKKWDRHQYLLSTAPVKIGPKGFLMLDSLMDDIFSATSLNGS